MRGTVRWHGAMPSVSGDDLRLAAVERLPGVGLHGREHRLLRVARRVRRELRAAARRVCLERRRVGDLLAQIFSTVAMTSAGTLFGMKIPK
jgi:hypothetical protein